MKKILFSALACSMMFSFASCNNDDLPEAPAGTDITNPNFPEGSDVKTLAVSIPSETRTRAGETTLPAWGIMDFATGGLTYRYGVYYEDGTPFYNTDKDAASARTINSSNFSLNIPLPAEQKKMKIFIWVDKTNADLYDIDWTLKKVGFDYSNEEQMNTLFEENMSGKADAFCYYGDITADTKNITLTRPFVQVSLYTNEADSGAMQNTYRNGIGSSLQLSYDGNQGDGYCPIAWYWEKDSFDFVLNQDERSGFSCFNSHTPGVKYDGTEPDPTATINGVRKYCLGVFYLFAPKSGTWNVNKVVNYEQDNLDGSSLSRLVGVIYDQNNYSSKNTANASYDIALPEVHANDRIVIHNGNDSGSGDGGILTNNSNLSVSINSSWGNTKI